MTNKELKRAIAAGVKAALAERGKKPKKPTWNGPVRISYLTDEELIQFWAWFNIAFLDPRQRSRAFLVGLIICTGLRIEETVSLRVEDCHDLPDAVIDVQSGKGGKPRSVDVLPQFVPHYKAFLAEARASKQEWLFPTRWGKRKIGGEPITKRAGHKRWKQVMKDAGLRIVGPHEGRRTFTTYASRISFEDADGFLQKMDLSNLAHQLGHSNVATTSKHYLGSMPGRRFVQRKIHWPDHVCPGYQVKSKLGLDFEIPKDPASLRALHELVKGELRALAEREA